MTRITASRQRSAILVMLTAATISACVAPSVQEDAAPSDRVPSLPLERTRGATEPDFAPLPPRSEPTLVRGTDRFTNPPSPAPRSRVSVGNDGAVSLSLVEVTIPAAAAAVLGDTLGLTYVVDEALEGRITFETSRPLNPNALLDAFQTVLELNGATLVVSDDLVAVRSINNAAPRFVASRVDSAIGRNVLVVPLQYIGAQEMTRLLAPILSGDTVIQANEARNLLFVSGGAVELDAVLDAINLFDADILSGRSVALFPLEFASPEAISAELDLVFDTREGGSLNGVVSFVPNERLRSILVITSRSEYLEDARDWIRRLDATAGRTERFTRVYELRNRTAEDLAPILSELLAEEANAPSESDAPLERSAGPRIVADEINNAIVALATGSGHRDVENLIRTLDVTPAQVLIEATIAEVRLTDELELGLRWFFESGNFETRFTDASTGAVGATFPGFSFLFNGGDAIVALDALSAVTDISIASAPSLLVLDNREAELRVGDQVPVATETATDATDPTAQTVTQVEFRDTGVILRIRPRIGESGRITMEIEQEVSDVVSGTSSGINSPTISQRLVRTTVAVQDGQTLALGGLIEDSIETVDRSIPGLGELPLVGAAFRSRADEERRTELLVLISPRVIRDGAEGSLVTAEFRRRLSAPDALMDGAQTGRHAVDRLLD